MDKISIMNRTEICRELKKHSKYKNKTNQDLKNKNLNFLRNELRKLNKNGKVSDYIEDFSTNDRAAIIETICMMNPSIKRQLLSGQIF